MRIRVLLFAELRDRAGVGELTLEVDQDATVGAIRERLACDFAGSADLLGRSVAAVNEEFADAAQPLVEGDELAFLPPVSGG